MVKPGGRDLIFAAAGFCENTFDELIDETKAIAQHIVIATTNTRTFNGVLLCCKLADCCSEWWWERSALNSVDTVTVELAPTDRIAWRTPAGHTPRFRTSPSGLRIARGEALVFLSITERAR
jgi:hypothetical protein